MCLCACGLCADGFGAEGSSEHKVPGGASLDIQVHLLSWKRVDNIDGDGKVMKKTLVGGRGSAGWQLLYQQWNSHWRSCISSQAATAVGLACWKEARRGCLHMLPEVVSALWYPKSQHLGHLATVTSGIMRSCLTCLTLLPMRR